MNEEGLFCKLFPEYTINGKPLHPYFDLFESGYEQAENRIKEFDAQKQLTKAMKHLEDLVYVVELGKNELATARILAEAKEFLKEIEK